MTTPLWPFDTKLTHKSYHFLLDYGGHSYYLSIVSDEITVIDRMGPNHNGEFHYLKIRDDGEFPLISSTDEYHLHKEGYDKACEIAQKYLSLV